MLLISKFQFILYNNALLKKWKNENNQEFNEDDISYQRKIYDICNLFPCGLYVKKYEADLTSIVIKINLHKPMSLRINKDHLSVIIIF